MTLAWGVLVALALTWAVPAVARDCSGTRASCTVPLGDYDIALPDGPGPFPTLLFFHGAGRSGDIVMGSDRVTKPFVAQGWAVIAPSGLPRPNSRFGPGWAFRVGVAGQRDEIAFTRQIIADAAQRFPIDPARIVVGGFSIGGSMAWRVACEAPQIASAFVPVAGAFWDPLPEPGTCAAPVRMMHTHGWRDSTVPLEGRPLGPGIAQGDVFASLAVLRRLNGCEGRRADAFDNGERFWTRWWTRCTPGSALRFALHSGSHGVPEGWAARAIDWYTSLPPASE